jgi:Protein ChrB, N-terminal
MSDPRDRHPTTRFVLLVYRVPARPSANRVYVWRMLKKIGAVYLQQSVCVFPQNARITRELRPILAKIGESGGEFHLLPLRGLDPDERRKLVAQFVEQAARHYGEIVENCEVDFTKEIEFETFRKNYTYEEAEEIRSEYEKIVAWFERVRERDWFGAPNRSEAERWLTRCARMLEEFEAKVYSAQRPHEDEGHGRRPSGKRRSARVLRLLEERPNEGEAQFTPSGEARTGA